MRIVKRNVLQSMFVICLTFSSLQAQEGVASGQSNWRQVVRARLPLYGHRNWIVIADSAYPAQSRDGIETVVSGADQGEVLQYVLGLLGQAKHVRPDILIDRELRYVPEEQAPGIEAYRSGLQKLFAGGRMPTLPHEQILAKLDAAGQTFRVLIIKTNMTLPYTTVFMQLNCAYWSDENEQRLRDAMNRQGNR